MHHRLGIASILDHMTNAAQARAAHYREQAAEFRLMAGSDEDDRLHRDLLGLAEKYEALADTLLASTE